MDDSSDKKTDGVEFLLELAKHQGVVCSTTKDGHVLIFSKQSLQQLLLQCEQSGQDKVVVFVKRSDMASMS